MSESRSDPPTPRAGERQSERASEDAGDRASADPHDRVRDDQGNGQRDGDRERLIESPGFAGVRSDAQRRGGLIDRTFGRVAAVLGRAGRLAVRRPGPALWMLAALSCALFAAGIAAVAAATIDRYAEAHPGSRGAMVVYLGDGVDDAHAAALVSELRGLRGVERAELVAPAESARRLNRALGADSVLLDGVDPASLPASVEVTLAPGVADVVALSPTVRGLRGAPGVADVVVEDAGDNRLAEALSTAREVASTGAGLFAALAVVIVLAAVRIGMGRSPREAAVLAMLGAPSTFVAIPSALAGALQGALAAALAALALGIVVHVAGASLGPVALVAPSAASLASLVGLGALVGLAGGGLAGAARAA